jgi:prevent-host-death family protein
MNVVTLENEGVASMKIWNVATAKAQFSALIKKAHAEPQKIVSRGHDVAVILSPEQYEEYARFMEKKKDGLKTLIDKTALLKTLAPDGDLTIELPRREEKSVRNPFL